MKFCRIGKYELSRQLKWVYIQVQGDGFLTYRGRCFAYDKVVAHDVLLNLNNGCGMPLLKAKFSLVVMNFFLTRTLRKDRPNDFKYDVLFSVWQLYTLIIVLVHHNVMLVNFATKLLLFNLFCTNKGTLLLICIN